MLKYRHSSFYGTLCRSLYLQSKDCKILQYSLLFKMKKERFITVVYIYIYIPSADMHVSAFTPRQCSFVTHPGV